MFYSLSIPYSFGIEEEQFFGLRISEDEISVKSEVVQRPEIVFYSDCIVNGYLLFLIQQIRHTQDPEY